MTAAFFWGVQIVANKRYETMASFTNIAVEGAATVVDPPSGTLDQLGIQAIPVHLSNTVNPQELGPDAFSISCFHQVMEAWWLVMTLEMIASMRSGVDILVNGLSGSWLMPAWDKCILSSTPRAALETFFYHNTEMHSLTSSPNRLVLLSFIPNKVKQLFRLGNSVVQLFNRAYARTQLQIESNIVIRFTESELMSQQQWILTTDDDTNISLRIAARLCWTFNILWSYNVAIDVAQVDSTDHPLWPIVIQALWYSGAQSIQHMDQDVAARLHGMLQQVHPLVNSNQKVNTSFIHYHGVKTNDRLRGSPRLHEWLTAMDHQLFQQHVTEVNQWRAGENAED
eukprot:s2323_g10.t1